MLCKIHSHSQVKLNGKIATKKNQFVESRSVVLVNRCAECMEYKLERVSSFENFEGGMLEAHGS